MKNEKRFSILQKDFETKKCYICGKGYAEIHEVFFGTYKREMSIKYGCCICLCKEHHTGTNGVHFNKEFDLKLKIAMQKQFEITYPDLDFLEIFKRRYY